MKNTSQLFIKQFELGPIQNFLYFLGDATAKEIAVVDPAWDVDFLCRQAEQLKYKITKVFLTHAHPDHINGLPRLLAQHNVPVYISKHEAPLLTRELKKCIEIDHGAQLKVGNITFDVLHTPGHTPGCQCFLTEGQLISGDTLFIDGCGRCDLPYSDPRAMYTSLHDVLMKLPDDTIIYPGHNYGPTPTDTIGHQKKTNPYLHCNSMEEFLTERMGL